MYRIVLIFILITFTFAGCDKTAPGPEEKASISEALSIIVNNGKVCISGYAYKDKKYSTKYWIDDVNTDATNFVNAIIVGSIYQESVDEEFRTVYVYKNFFGEIEIYKFDQGSLAEGGKVFYYKNNTIINMDTTALGTVSAVFVSQGVEHFAGFFGEIFVGEGGETLSPTTPFYWDGTSKPVALQVPGESFFSGVSTVYATENDDIYVGGSMSFPMYWENSQAIVLNTLYGEVRQIKVSGTDVYAVGLYNKNNSNSTGHTACYWKNGELTELEDNAQASGIFIHGNDIYVVGSVGRVPVDYEACYWKNGIRVDLPN